MTLTTTDPLAALRALLDRTGRFELKQCLGQGGTGVVYRAHDRQRGGDIALKSLRLPSPAAIYQLKREFRALADVAHPNLVVLHELFCVGDEWCLTMELVDGVDFLSHVSGGRLGKAPLHALTTQVVPIGHGASSRGADVLADALLDANARTHTSGPSDQVCPIDLARLPKALAQLVDGVAALHAAGRLHLDLKPMNVLVRADGRVTVLDFGLVRETEGRASQSHGEHIVVGTPAYMAPEQATSAPPTAAADWYAVGAMLYEALTGTPPFLGTPFVLLMSKVSRDPPAPHEVVREVPRDLSDLCMKLLARDPAQRAGEQALRAWLGERTTRPPPSVAYSLAPSTVFVGRTDALSALRVAYDRAQQGRPSALLVHGGSGIGKTKLVHEFMCRIEASDRAVVLEGRCFERESVPYKAFDSVMDALSRHLRRLSSDEVAALMPRHIDALVRVFPVLSRVPLLADHALAQVRMVEEQKERDLAFDALKNLLGRMAELGPVVVFVDDLQWGDRDSALLVKQILGPPNGAEILLLGTYRSEEEGSSPFLRALFAPSADASLGAQIERLELGPLSDAEMLTLTRNMLEQERADASVAPVLARESVGNPFFAGELVRNLAQRLLGAQPMRSLPTSFSLEHVLLERVTALSPHERDLLELIAVIGRPLEKALAFILSDLGVRGEGSVDRLRSLRLVRTRSAGELDLVEPYHDRIREIVSHSVPKARRAELHRKLANELESRRRGDADLLMLHYGEAGDVIKAAKYAKEAALLASRSLAFDHAAMLLRRAIELSPEQEASASAELYADLGHALEQAGRSLDAAEAYLTAAGLAEAAAATALRRRAAEQLLVCGHYTDGMALLRETLPAYGLELAASGRSALMSLLWRRARLSLRGWSFTPREEKDVDPAVLARIDACYAVASGLGMLDSLVAADVQSKGVLVALTAGEPFRVLRALTYEAAFRCGSSGGLSGTRKVLARARTLASSLGRSDAEGLVEMSVGFYHHHGDGDILSARAPYERAEELLLGTPGMNGEMVALRCNLLTLLDWQGDVAALVERVPALAQDAERRGDHFLSTGLVSSAVYWLARDQSDELLRHVEACRALWPQDEFVMPYYWMLVAEGQRDVYVDNPRACIDRMAAAWRDLERSFYLSIPTVRIEVQYPRARAALLLAARGEDQKRMLRLAESDTRTLEGTRRRYALALAALLRAGLCAVRGHADEARERLEGAIEQCQEQGLALHAAAAQMRLGVHLGGDAGKELTERAERTLRERGVRDPHRLTAALTPGL